MTNNGNLNPACLTEEDLYCFLTQKGDSGGLSHREAHLAACPQCRQALADLLELLHPEKELQRVESPEPTDRQLQETINLIQDVSRRERSKRENASTWLRWPVAAAAAIGFIALALLGARIVYENRKSQAFFAQAKSIVDQDYTGTSPARLRLVLPFSPTSTMRNTERHDSLRAAENLLFQALAIRDDMVEAHLGLGLIYLRESEFGRARSEFQRVLDIDKGEAQAWNGRGVAQFEQAIQSLDPLLRTNLLKSALSDFDAVLKFLPDSTEARYNKIRALFELGLPQEALKEIQRYLSRDSGSRWAEELKDLKAKMEAIRSGASEGEIDRGAYGRDRFALEKLARLVPYRMPAAIWSAMRRSLQADQTQAKNGRPSSDDLRWAAETMEAAYAEATEDHSFRSFIDFYVGLSPPERRLKRSLDAEFQTLVTLHQNGKFDTVLSRSKPLEPQYTQIRDYWQLLNLHHLRGNSLYVGKADFKGAEAEYAQMHQMAARLDAPEPALTALAGLATVCSMEGKFDESLSHATRLKALADKHNLEAWQITAAMNLGNQYRRTGQSPHALEEYAAALGFACRLSDSLKIAEIFENSGIVMDREMRLEEAGALYRLAVQQQDTFLSDRATTPTPEFWIRRFNLILKQGDLALRAGKPAEAETLFKECLLTLKPGMRELESRSRAGLAETYLRTKRLGEAEVQLKRAIAISESGKYRETEWKAKFLMGRAFESTNRPQEAISLYRQSIAVLEQMRQNVRSTDLKQSFLNNRFDPFKAVVALLFKSGDKETALQYVDQAKAVTLKDDLPSVPVSRQIPEQVAAADFPLVEYFFVHEGLLIFFSGQGRVEVAYQETSSNDLSLEITGFLKCIKENDAPRFDELARHLYAELIGPIERSAFGKEGGPLVILPDGPLHRLPFAGLKDGQGRFLIEKTPVAYAPSRSVFQHCLSAGRGKSTSRDRDLLLIDGTKDLPYARDELSYISKLYGGSALILGAKDLSRFEREVQRSALVHFSGHAMIRQGKPVLMLQGLPGEVYLDCQRIRNWECGKSSRLVNLAGCSTGIGPIAEGEAPWGLVPAFLNAGVPAVIASLMPVDDASTKMLDCRFYDLLKKGLGKAKALQLAQLTMLDAVRQRSELGPQSWIPYILVGNPH
jgi:CHAT domain-containing protein